MPKGEGALPHNLSPALVEPPSIAEALSRFAHAFAHAGLLPQLVALAASPSSVPFGNTLLPTLEVLPRSSPSSAMYFLLHFTQTRHRPSDPSPEPAAQRCSSPSASSSSQTRYPHSQLRVASTAPLVREHLDPVHSPMMQCAASQDSADSPLPVSPPSRPADAVPLHHCSNRLQSLLLERPHPTGSRLHLAELLRLAAVDSSHVLHQQHPERVAHVLGNRVFARTSSSMFCRFPRSSTVAPTFCTSRVHRTSASSPIFAPPSTLANSHVAIMLSSAN